MGRTIVSNDGCFEWDEEKLLPIRKNMEFPLSKPYKFFSIPESWSSVMQCIPITKSGILQSVTHPKE